MRARLLVATLLLALPASAHAQLPEATRPGIEVSRGPSGRVAIRFLDTKAGRAAYRPFAGRTVTVRCQSVGEHPFGSGPVGVATAKVHFRPTLSTLRLRVRGNVNLCTLRTVRVATSAAARRFLADLDQAEVLLEASAVAARRGAAAAARGLHGKGVVLATPGATPRRGRIGLYARGGVVAAVARSASGRRLFLKGSGDEVQTNLLDTLDQLREPVFPRAARLPSGDAGTPLPASSDPEITARRDGANAVIDFTGEARDALRGQRVTVSCSHETRDLAGGEGEEVIRDVPAPPAGQPLSVGVPSRFHLCAVRYGQRFARVALDDAGRAELEEGTIAAGLDRVVHAAGAAAADGGYPTAQALSDRLDGAVAPLAAPTDMPPDLRIGAWSDGARRLTLVAVARTGRRLFVEVDGDTVRTNAFSVPDLP